MSSNKKRLDRRFMGMLRFALGTVSAGLVLFALAVGLYPFNFKPENNVGVDPETKGITFRKRSIAHTEMSHELGAWFGDTGGAALSMTFVCMEEPMYRVARIMSFVDGNGRELIFIGQHREDLIVQMPGTGRDDLASMKLPGILEPDSLRLLRMKILPDHILLWVNGRVRSKKLDPLLLANTPGKLKLVLGLDPQGVRYWRGTVNELALFSTHMHPDSFPTHEDISPGDLVASYLFDTQTQTITNRAGNCCNIHIPKTVSVFDKQFLRSPLRDFRADRAYLLDVIVNIIGFMPVGFVFALTFLVFRPRAGFWEPVGITAVASGIISVLIELGQVWLISRDSQLTDLILNTAGGTCGALVLMLTGIIFCWVTQNSQGSQLDAADQSRWTGRVR